MRIWHDDIRPAPPGWTWARTNAQARLLLDKHEVEEISLDHDMGLHYFTEEEIAENPDLIMGRGSAQETGLDLVRWMVAYDLVPPRVTIHSWNPAGAVAMAAALNDAGHDCTIREYDTRGLSYYDREPEPEPGSYAEEHRFGGTFMPRRFGQGRP